MSISRRGFISGGAVTAAGLALPRAPDAGALVNSAVSGFITDPTGKPGIAWPVGLDIRDFGAKGDGVTDDARAINAAIVAARKMGGAAIHFPQPPVHYLTLAAIDATVDAGKTSPGLIFRGDFSQNVNAPLIFARHFGHVFDCAGATDCVFENITVWGDATRPPQTAWFLARNSAGSSAGRHRFLNCRVNGHFSVAAFYNYASEEDELQGCWFTNSTANADVVVITGYNNTNTTSAGTLTSSFIAIAAGGQSMITFNVLGGSYRAWSGTANVFNLDGSQGVRVYGSWMYAASDSASGHALVKVNLANAASSLCTFDGVVGEQGGTYWQAHGFWFGGSAGSVSCTGWTITNCRLPNKVNAIHGDDHAVFDAFHIDQLSDPQGHGINVAEFNNSYFKGQNNLFRWRTSLAKSVLIGNSVNWRGGRKTDFLFLDTFTGAVTTSAGYDFSASPSDASSLATPVRILDDYKSATFTPSMTVGGRPVGALSKQTGTYTKIGNRLFFDLYLMVGAVGHGKGQVAIGGLPFVAASSNPAGEEFSVTIKVDGSNLLAGQYGGYVAGGTSSVYPQIMIFGSPTRNTNMSDGNLAVGTALMISGSYRV